MTLSWIAQRLKMVAAGSMANVGGTYLLFARAHVLSAARVKETKGKVALLQIPGTISFIEIWLRGWSQ
jgi:hypothetical protein